MSHHNVRLFELFGNNKIGVAWEYNASGIIWHIRPTHSGTFIGEERDVEQKKASFFSLDRETGRVLWRDRSFTGEWWVGIETVLGNTLFLHGFASPDLPVHRGIIAVDLSTGRKLWENQELRFVTAGEDTILAAKESQGARELFEVNMQTGEVAGMVSHADQFRPKDWSSPGALEGGEEMALPVPLAEMTDRMPDVASAVRKNIPGADAAGTGGIVELGKLIIFNFFEPAGGSTPAEPAFINSLRVVERSTGKLLFADTIAKNARAAAPETFFVLNDTLYYIRDRHRLTAVHLAP